jgi:hypothetical protein
MNVGSSSPKGQIVAPGGGGFSMAPENTLLDDFVLSLVPRDLPRICFLPTASADSAPYIVRFYRAFSGRALPTDLTIFGLGRPEGKPGLLGQVRGDAAVDDACCAKV